MNVVWKRWDGQGVIMAGDCVAGGAALELESGMG